MNLIKAENSDNPVGILVDLQYWAPLALAGQGFLALAMIDGAWWQWLLVALAGGLGANGLLRAGLPLPRTLHAVLVLAIAAVLLVTTGGVDSSFLIWLLILMPVFPPAFPLRQSILLNAGCLLVYLVVAIFSRDDSNAVVVGSRLFVLAFFAVIPTVYVLHLRRRHAEMAESAAMIQAQKRELDHLSLILRTVSDAVILTDLDFTIRRWNKGAEVIYGWSAAEAIGQSVGTLLGTTYSDADRAAILEAFQTDGRWQGEVIQRHKDGHELAISASVDQYRSDDGHLAGVLAINRDISLLKEGEHARQKLFEEAQRHSRELEILYEANQALTTSLNIEKISNQVVEKMAQLFGYENCVVLVIDPETGILDPVGLADQRGGMEFVEEQRQFIRRQKLTYGDGIVGWVAEHGETVRLGNVSLDPRYRSLEDEEICSELCVPLKVGDQILGVLNVEATHPDAFSETDEMLVTALAGPAAVAIENARLYTAVKRQALTLEQNVQERTAELKDRVAEVERLNRGMLNLLQDLRATNRQLEATSRQLEVANAELESFSYSVSHDLRAPLRHVNGFVNLLMKRDLDKLDPTSQRYLDNIASSVERMSELIDGLLTLSRTSRFELQTQAVDLNSLMAAVINSLTSERGERAVTWEIEPLPNVDGDPHLLRIVWQNLIANALKFSQGEPEPIIQIGVLASETGAGESGLARDTPDKRTIASGRVTLYIKDNGVGFDSRYSHKLFGVFQRLHRDEDYSGTGIGLATTKRIVQRHGGEIWAESELGQGAAFYLTLRPIAHDDRVLSAPEYEQP